MRERGNETASSEREERLDRNNDVKRTENERARIFTWKTGKRIKWKWESEENKFVFSTVNIANGLADFSPCEWFSKMERNRNGWQYIFPRCSNIIKVWGKKKKFLEIRLSSSCSRLVPGLIFIIFVFEKKIHYVTGNFITYNPYL